MAADAPDRASRAPLCGPAASVLLATACWPALIVLMVVTLVPMIYLVLVSLTPLDLTRPETVWDFSQPFAQLRAAVRTTAASTTRSGCRPSCRSGRSACSCCSAFSSRCCSTSARRFLEALRTVFLIPMVLPPIVVAIIWKVIYTPDISPLHWGDRRARLRDAVADHPSRLGADRDHRRRHLAVVSVHHADDPGRAADDARGICRGGARSMAPPSGR